MINKEYIWIGVVIVAILLIWLYSKSNSNVTKNEESISQKIDSTQNVAVLEISLQKAKEFILYILLHSDGTINRSGIPNENFTGTKINSSKEVYMGQSDDKMLKEMISYLTEELAKSDGEHNLGGTGEIIELMIVLQIGDRGFKTKYIYGSESSGPPPFIKDFVKKAINLTDQWVVEIKKNKEKS